MLKRWATYLQMRCALMKRATLVTLFIIVTAIGCGVCFLVLYRALEHPPALHRLFPLPHDSIRIK